MVAPNSYIYKLSKLIKKTYPNFLLDADVLVIKEESLGPGFSL